MRRHRLNKEQPKKTCAKCGKTSIEDPAVTFHRFPLPSKHGSLKAKVWAKFCYPNDDWSSDDSLHKLYALEKYLCCTHFDDSSFTNSERTRLNKFAIPKEAQNILAQVRNEVSDQQLNVQLNQVVQPSTSQCTSTELLLSPPRPKLIKLDPVVQASTSRCSDSNPVEYSNEDKPQCTNKEPHKGILGEISVKSVAELTPRKQKMYKRCRKNLSEILRLRKKYKAAKKCKRNILEALHSDEAVKEVLQSNLSSPFYRLLQSQLKNTRRKLGGRRWTLDDKVLALSLYKKSRSCYRLLKRLFCLPSASSLKALLNKIPLSCGINEQVVDTLKEMTQKRTIQDNLCVLAFDEMSIRKSLSYNVKSDQIDGYQDHAGQGRTKEIASKALTFMAIGLRKKWKQPIAYYFSGANVTADRLSALMKEVLGACFKAGLEVVATVCDCDGVNIRALNALGSATDHPYFVYEGHEIATISDPPHLLKCFRNNFMKHDVEFQQDMEIDGKKITGVAKWRHIEELYEMEKSNPNFVFAPALTKQHLQPNGKQKMKVRMAAQVLSHSVAAGLYAKVAQNELPQDASATAKVVADMDKLFDAVNGDTPDRKRGKPLLTNMSSTSLHLEHFSKMKVFFKQMKFLGARSKPPSQEGWLRTLNAIERVYTNLKRNYNVKTLSPKRLNQDPIENCFGCVRTNCGSNPNPTSTQFVAALKTSMMTNLINTNKNRNCDDDDSELLNNFKIFLCKGNENTQIESPAEEATSSVEDQVGTDDIAQCSGETQACAYICGFITKNMNINCATCKEIFLTNPNTELCHIFTSFKEYDEEKISLNYIKPHFGHFVEHAATAINTYLKEKPQEKKNKCNLLKLCEGINSNCLKGCGVHDKSNLKTIINSTISICIKRFCVVKNREFVEEASKQSLIRKIKILKNV